MPRVVFSPADGLPSAKAKSGSAGDLVIGFVSRHIEPAESPHLRYPSDRNPVHSGCEGR